MTAEDLTRHVSDAAGLRALIEEHPPASLAAPEARAALVRARDALRDAEESARSPFGIGLVGEMSAGKSLLLGVLLGLPELLPVGDEAVTGNVTVVQARPAPRGGRSRQTSVQVEYFDEAQAVEYLRHLRDALADQSAAAGLDADLVGKLRGIHLDTPDCTPLLAFRDTHLGGAIGASLSGVLDELALVSAALDNARRSGRRLFGTSAVLDAQLAGAAVVLPGPAGLSAPDPRLEGGGLSAEMLRATMPLVRRVVREVEVDRGVWDVTPFPGGELRLIDFPGLNSAFSAVRDGYVCGVELRTVHTVLILLKTTSGATDTPERLRRMWLAAQRDDGLQGSVLAAVSRFHELPVTEDLLKPWLDDADRSTSRERLLERVPVLGELLAGAERLVAQGRGDRIVFTSAMRALHVSGQLREVGPGFVSSRHLGTQLPLANARAAVWRTVGDRLTAAGVGGALGGMLTAFADDGGIGRLRDALLDHVGEHGVALRLAQLDGRRREAREALRALCDALTSGGGAKADADAQTRVSTQLFALNTVWRDVRARAATELLDARGLTLPRDSTDTQERTLFEELEADVADRVFAWESWRRLLDAVRDAHVDPRSLPDDRPPPLTSDDLFAEFRDTCRDIQSRNGPRLLAALEQWLVGHQHRLVAIAGELGAILTPDAFARLKSATPAETDLLLDQLRRATTLGWMRDGAEKAVREQLPDDSGDLRLRARFPLRLGQVLPWHPDSNAAAYARHQTTVARYRRDMAAMVLHESLARLADAQRAVSACLVSQVHAFLDEMSRGDVTKALVRAVAGEGAQARSSTGFAEELRALARTSVYWWERDTGPLAARLGDTGTATSFEAVLHVGGA
ncbi:dynamin family protein [Streptomyces sp. Q6]|uniref:Dynamin family protein n=1 Tax=Streptomyces citrinus TaxID=3118173 RepID=A0ACD5AKK3_9ACTN